MFGFRLPIDALSAAGDSFRLGAPVAKIARELPYLSRGIRSRPLGGFGDRSNSIGALGDGNDLQVRHSLEDLHAIIRNVRAVEGHAL